MGIIVDLGDSEVLTQRRLDRRLRIQDGIRHLNMVREVIATPDFSKLELDNRLEARRDRLHNRVLGKITGVTRDLDVFASSNPRPLAGGEFRLNLSYPRADFSVTAQPDDGYHIAYNLYHSVGNLSGYIGGGGGLDRLEDDHAAHLIRPFVSGARWALKQVVECLPH